MKRRTFGLLASTGLASMAGMRFEPAKAQSAPDASLLQTTLTPMGGERAGNADGSIPAWTGGYSTVPAGFKPGDYIGELWPDEQPTLVIDSSNVTQYADKLSEGCVAMVQKYGFSMKVYPTHRTACAPQAIYDAIAANVATAKLEPAGPQLGFTGAFGGIPFPIPDANDPLAAGAQIIWNQNATWRGYACQQEYQSWSVSNGQQSLAFGCTEQEKYPYYQAKSISEYNGILYKQDSPYWAPPNLVGQNIIVWAYSEPYKNPQQAWELLNGQGRVRRAPEVSFDTPSPQANGIANYDEYYGFNGSLERYDWKCLGKKEMYIPYNNNKMYGVTPESALLAHFIDPEIVRWELHRVWVVEATLHPGERSVDARRRMYVDEDTFLIGANDIWDANNQLVKTTHVFNNVRPELPGTIYGQSVIYNLQTADYVTVAGIWNQAAKPGGILFFDDFPENLTDPQEMAANAQY
jgi:hypothetical protein